MEFPATGAREANAQSVHVDASDAHGASGEKRERFVRYVGVGAGGQHVARLRANEHEHAALGRVVGDGDVFAVCDRMVQPVEISLLAHGTGDRVERVVAGLGERHLGFDTALFVEQVVQ